MAECRDIGILNRIFGFGAVAEHAARDPIEPLIMPLHDRGKSVRVPVERAPDQFGIVQSGKIGFPDCRLHHDGSLSLLRCVWRREVPRGLQR